MNKKKKYKSQKSSGRAPSKVNVSANSSQSGWKQFAALAVILIIVCIVYLPSLGGSFVWDDDHYIQNDPLIHAINLKAIFSNYVMGNYHPFTMLVYSIEYHFWGLNEKGYHVVNMLIHLVNVILVFYVILLISRNALVALTASLLFGIHPMHVESVAWVSELKDLLYTGFFLLSYLCYLKYLQNKKWKSYIFCLLLFICSLFSKGMAVCFPVLLVLTDYFIPYLWGYSSEIKKVRTKRLLEKIPFFVIAIIFGIVAIYAQGSTEAMRLETKYVFAQRIVIAGFGFMSYLFKLALPFNLCAFYPYPIQGDRIELPVEYYVYSLIFLALAFGVYYTFRFTKKIFFGLSFFAITIFLVLQILPVGSAIMADRYSYLSSVGIFYLFGEGLYSLWNNKNSFLNGRVLAPMLLTGFIVFFSFRTEAMCNVWKNSLNLWSDVIRQYQSIPYAYNNRGVLFMSDKPEQAIDDFTHALKIKADYAEGLNNRGAVLLNLKRYDEALIDFNNAIAAKPSYAEAYNHRGLVFEAQKKDQEALNDFGKAIELKPDFAKAYYNRGTFFINQGKLDEALNDYNKAIEADPVFVKAYNNRGNLYSVQKKNTDAISDYNKVIELEPNSPDAYYNKAVTENNEGKKEDACNDLQRAANLGYQAASDLHKRICQ